MINIQQARRWFAPLALVTSISSILLVSTVHSTVAVAQQTNGNGAQFSIEQFFSSQSYSAIGELIVVNYVVTNIGNTPIPAPIEVMDTSVNGAICPEPDSGQIFGVLSPGEVLTCSGVYSVSQEDLDLGFILSSAFAQSAEAYSETAESEIYVDTAAYDPGTDSAGSTDSGSTDTGSTDTGSTDSGSTDSGSTDSGSTDTVGSTDSKTSKKNDGKAYHSAKNTVGKESEQTTDAGDVDVRVSDAISPTRDANWFSANQRYVAACLTALGGQIDLGTLVVRDEAYDDEIDATVKGRVRGDADSDVETALSMSIGLLDARGGKLSTGKRRGKLARSCVRASQQMLVAQCNVALFGSAPEFDLEREGSRLAKHCGIGSRATVAKKRVKRVHTKLRKFNDSGLQLALPALNIEVLDAQVLGDDPTDATD